jgi:hypothetical protein
MKEENEVRSFHVEGGEQREKKITEYRIMKIEM